MNPYQIAIFDYAAMREAEILGVSEESARAKLRRSMFKNDHTVKRFGDGWFLCFVSHLFMYVGAKPEEDRFITREVFEELSTLRPPCADARIVGELNRITSLFPGPRPGPQRFLVHRRLQHNVAEDGPSAVRRARGVGVSAPPPEPLMADDPTGDDVAQDATNEEMRCLRTF